MKNQKSPALGRFQSDMHRLLTTVLQRDIDDPMLRGIIVTRFELGDENGVGIAFIHSLLPVEKKECISRLNRMSPHILHKLRKALPKRRMPSLQFRWDDKLDESQQLLDTMKTLSRG
ncbi:MAG: hypothetical protein AUK35_03605 [Zetaproteobacteria bacterium CG2_30_46_52]|nr:MAG: hypothetical protein AUK35_03605 [Zetaproteobacteria bacterium CG2_30_46_52]